MDLGRWSPLETSRELLQRILFVDPGCRFVSSESKEPGFRGCGLILGVLPIWFLELPFWFLERTNVLHRNYLFLGAAVTEHSVDQFLAFMGELLIWLGAAVLVLGVAECFSSKLSGSWSCCFRTQSGSVLLNLNLHGGAAEFLGAVDLVFGAIECFMTFSGQFL